MIEVTDEMVKLAVDTFLRAPASTIGQIDAAMREALAAVFALVERQRVEKEFGPRGHAFEPHDDPAFGSAFGGGCGAMVETPPFGPVICGWPRRAHRDVPLDDGEVGP